jgi:hypothetical protein
MLGEREMFAQLILWTEYHPVFGNFKSFSLKFKRALAQQTQEGCKNTYLLTYSMEQSPS